MARLAAPLVLASASPRRRALLAQVGITVEVRPSTVEEIQGPSEAAEVFVTRAAREKTLDVLAGLDASRSDAFVVGADTIVLYRGLALGKPVDDAHASSMLDALMGDAHEVVTAVALGRVGRGLLGETRVSTRVRFRAASADEVRRYVATGEGRDKAGAYAVQGIGAGFVAAIDGSYPNVVGLPLVETLALLREHGALVEWP